MKIRSANKVIKNCGVRRYKISTLIMAHRKYKQTKTFKLMCDWWTRECTKSTCHVREVLEDK